MIPYLTEIEFNGTVYQLAAPASAPSSGGGQEGSQGSQEGSAISASAQAALAGFFSQMAELIPSLAFASSGHNGPAALAAAQAAAAAFTGGSESGGDTPAGPIYYTVTKTLAHCGLSNSAGRAEHGYSYTTLLSIEIGYTLSSVTVTMDGVDITAAAWNNGSITIPEVIGDIAITATAAQNVYTVSGNLTHCALSNSAGSVAHGSGYSAVLTVNSGYVLSLVSVTMGGVDMTASAWNSGSGTVTIGAVTGNVVITATAAARTLSAISAAYDGGGRTVRAGDSLDSLKPYLTVTAAYNDGNTETVSASAYTLSGTLTEGTRTVTVSYGGKTATFTLTVAAAVALSAISASYSGSGHTVYAGDSLDSLKPYLTVTAAYTDSTTETLNASDYTLSGTLTVGTSTVTVSFGGKTDTFTVTVEAVPVVLSSISALLNLNGTTITTNNSLNDLKQYLTVTATYSDSSTATVASTDYTLSGTLTVGNSTVTVAYGGKTAAFTVPVRGALPSGYTELTYIATDGSQYIDPQITSGSVRHAEYEIMVTALNSDDTSLSSSDQAYTKGNHIFSGRNCYFPYLKGNSSGWQTELAANRFGEQAPSGNGESVSYSWNLNQRYVLSGFANDEVKVDGVTQYHINTGGSATGETMTFFAYGYEANKRKYRFRGRLYYAKLYDSSNTLIHDYVPCKNSSDVVGLYDLVGGAFISSATADALIAGEAV